MCRRWCPCPRSEDPHVLLAMALVVSALAVEIPTGVDVHLSVIPIVLLEVADVGLQMAKRGGRNRVVAA